MTPAEIVERIMSAHWDMAACRCWVCENGTKYGLAPREQYLQHRNNNRKRCPIAPGAFDTKTIGDQK